MKFMFAGVVALAIAAPAFGQDLEKPAAVAPTATIAPTPTQQVAILQPVQQENILRAGTEIPLLVREELTTKKKKLRVGQRFQMEVAANVDMNGVTVIPAGTPAVGEITEVRNKGMWGKSGYINARIISLRLGDRTMRLSGTFDDKGVTGTGGVVASVALIPLAGFFTTGTSAMIAAGSGVKGYLDEDIAFRTVPVQPKVLEVPVSQPAPATVSQPVVQPVSEGASGSAPTG